MDRLLDQIVLLKERVKELEDNQKKIINVLRKHNLLSDLSDDDMKLYEETVTKFTPNYVKKDILNMLKQ